MRLLIAARLRVGFLLRNRIRLAQILPTVGGDLRQIPLRDHLLAAGAGLR